MPGLGKIFLASLLALAGGWIDRSDALAQSIHPVVDVNEHCLIGGVARGKWLEAEELAPLIKGGERYRLYTLKGATGEVVTGSAVPAEEDCNGAKEVKFSPEVREGIAVGGDWNALPRVPRVMGTNDPVYRRAVARILNRQGFKKPMVNITQVLRVDLDGDGREEVLVSANYLAEGLSVNGGPMAVHATPGDYLLVFVRKIVGGKVRDIPLVEGYYPQKNSDYWTPQQAVVAAVLDLNGDGRMEIIIRGGYYEGSWSSVFRLDGAKVENVFGCGCGA